MVEAGNRLDSRGSRGSGMPAARRVRPRASRRPNQPAARPLAGRIRARSIVVGSECPGDGVEDVGGRDQTFEMAVFVMRRSARARRPRGTVEGHPERRCVSGITGAAPYMARMMIVRPAGQQGGEQVAQIHDAHDLVGLAFARPGCGSDEPRSGARGSRPRSSARSIPPTSGPGRHQRANGTIAEAQHAGDHSALVRSMMPAVSVLRRWSGSLRRSPRIGGLRDQAEQLRSRVSSRHRGARRLARRRP